MGGSFADVPVLQPIRQVLIQGRVRVKRYVLEPCVEIAYALITRCVDTRPPAARSEYKLNAVTHSGRRGAALSLQCLPHMPHFPKQKLFFSQVPLSRRETEQGFIFIHGTYFLIREVEPNLMASDSWTLIWIRLGGFRTSLRLWLLLFEVISKLSVSYMVFFLSSVLSRRKTLCSLKKLN